MDFVFLRLFNMSMAAGWLIAVVIVLRLFMKRVPKWLNCMLWAMVAVRLLCPFSLESTFSLIPETETISPGLLQSGGYSEITPVGSELNDLLYSPAVKLATCSRDFPLVNQVRRQILVTTSINSRTGKSDLLMSSGSGNLLHHFLYIAGVVWVIGVVVLLGYAFIGYCGLRGKVREAIPLQDNIWLCDVVKSPFILGVFRPQVYLSSSINAEQGKYVLAHEQAHLKRRDHWWKLLGYLLLAIYWFHPLVWGAYFLFCRDVELACDEMTVRHMDMKEKKEYAEALVVCSMQKKLILTLPLAFGEVGVKERVKTILHYKKTGFWVIVAAITVCVAVGVCFLTNPKNDTFHIKIVVPAGAEEGFYYSHEEISPNKNRVILWSEDGMGDTQVILHANGGNDESTDEPVYMTPGMPVKMQAKKGVWYQIGVNVSNPTQEEKIVYVRVKGVTVRIADSVAGADNHAVGSGTEAELHPDSERELEKSVLDMDKTSLAEEDTITFMGTIVDNTMDTVQPAILVKPMEEEITYEYIWFTLPEGEAHWVEQVNNVIVITCKNTFEDSDEPWGELISIEGIEVPSDQMIESESTAEEALGELVALICAEPSTSSNPQDYIDAHTSEYNELVEWGEDTLHYCFKRFRIGGETGLEGKIMALACEEILQIDDVAGVNAAEAMTGQFWYDTLFTHASNLVVPYI